MKKILKKGIIAIVSIIMITGSVYATEADTTRPAITINEANPSSINEGETVSYVVSTNDNVGVVAYSVRASDVTMKGFTATVSITKTSAFASAFVRTITFSNVQSTDDSTSKYFVLSEGVSMDEAGNVSKVKNSPAFAIKTKAVEADTTRPAMTINEANPGLIYVGEKVVYTVSVNDNVGISSFNIATSDIALNGFTADISISGSGNTRTVTLTNVSGTVGTSKYITVAEGVAKDAAGNVTKVKNSPAFEIKAKTVVEADTTRPAMTISEANPGSIYVGEKVVYIISVNDNVEITSFNLTVSDIKLNGFTADISISGSGLVRTVTLTNVKGTVETFKYITVAEGVAKDAAGNVTKQKNSPEFVIKAKLNNNEEDITPNTGDEKDDTPKTGVVDYSLMAGLISTLSLAGIVVTKKYFK